MHFHVTAGQVHDSKVFDTLLVGADECLVDGANATIAWPITLCADKAYLADWIDREIAEALGKSTRTIPMGR